MAKAEETFCSKEMLLGAKARRFANINVPGLGAPVRIRSLTEREKSDYECRFLDKKGNTDRGRIKEMRRALICLTVVDANGNTLLADEDAKALEDLDGGITTTIFAESQKHCGFIQAESEAEEARKN